MMKRWFYRGSLAEFLVSTEETIIGEMTLHSSFAVETTQRDAWREQVQILQHVLAGREGTIFFEYSIPRMGRRVDVVVLLGPVVFVVEFKVGASRFEAADIDQVWDYALDLANFHEASHHRYIAPILVATQAKADATVAAVLSSTSDKVFEPMRCSPYTLPVAIESGLTFADGDRIESDQWANGRYCPTPTIVEAATALYNNHSVENISRSDAGAINLQLTSKTVSRIIADAQAHKRKVICFVTGVPGAGKTLVGLNVATTHIDRDSELYSVFLSGNGPLVDVLREALVRDKVAREKAAGRRMTKKLAGSEVKMFIQNVHHFRDDCLVTDRSPVEHVALFDEAQRAWDHKQTAAFMKQKKDTPGFTMSEPEFLISCLDRHDDWAVVVCLVGGGQEINRGEAGIGEWIRALQAKFSHWDVCLSQHLTDSEYAAGDVLRTLDGQSNVTYLDELHLAVSMRSYRAENVSLLVKQMLDMDVPAACETLKQLEQYPIVLTRSLLAAKRWLKQQARGSERYGIVVSSQAERLKPHAIDIRPKVDPVHWFLNGKDDVRSSYYLEDVATEFHVQGLELDWACVTWDADFRPGEDGWIHKSFRGNKWMNIRQEARKQYLKNAYRVLLTRARQGMVIVVPEGDAEDHTRQPEFYDPIYEYLHSIGFPVLS